MLSNLLIIFVDQDISPVMVIIIIIVAVFSAFKIFYVHIVLWMCGRMKPSGGWRFFWKESKKNEFEVEQEDLPREMIWALAKSTHNNKNMKTCRALPS